MSEARLQDADIAQSLTERLLETKDTMLRNALELAGKTLKCEDVGELRVQASFLRMLEMRLRSIEREAKMQGLEPKDIYREMQRGGESFEREFRRLRRECRERSIE